MLLRMETKTEEKIRYYFNNKSVEKKCLDFSMNICEFEDCLKNFIDMNADITSYKNWYKVYGINNKFLKIYQDGSCFCYTVRNNAISEVSDNLFIQVTSTAQIYNDDFPGLKNYWTEEIYEEIVFKINEINLIFCKFIDVPRDIVQYSVYLEPKDSTVSVDLLKGVTGKLIFS